MPGVFFRLVFISLFDERTGSLIQAVRRFFSRAHTLTGALRGAKATLNQVRILPVGSKEKDYPTRESILASLEGLRVVQFDALAETRAIGDDQGRTANVVALGLLSTIEPLCRIPEGAWQRALLAVTPTELARRANVAAFSRGRAVR